MNKDFKVGQRVWVKEHRESGVVTAVEMTTVGGKNVPYYRLDSGFNYLDEQLHQTADDMFEELGYDKGIDFPKTILNYEKFNGKGYGKYISFDRLTEDYICGEIIPKVPQPEIFRVSKEEHQAIHQKLIELGWI